MFFLKFYCDMHIKTPNDIKSQETRPRVFRASNADDLKSFSPLLAQKFSFVPISLYISIHCRSKISLTHLGMNLSQSLNFFFLFFFFQTLPSFENETILKNLSSRNILLLLKNRFITKFSNADHVLVSF